MHAPKLKGRLHRVPIPTLVLRLTADRLTGEAYGRALAAAVPEAKFVTIPGAGHFPHIEQPQTFATHVLAFFRMSDGGDQDAASSPGHRLQFSEALVLGRTAQLF
jgi:pimeloyl-ACP methyl ester carboxylesterase